MKTVDWEREWERANGAAERWEREWESAQHKLDLLLSLCDLAVRQGIGLGFQEQVRAVLEGRDPFGRLEQMGGGQ